jgi:hypothetical protein
LTLVCFCIDCSLLSGQTAKKELKVHGIKVGFYHRRIINNRILDTICYQFQYITPEGRILTDTTITCNNYIYDIFTPFQWGSNRYSLKVDTFDFLHLFDGLQQFNEPILWNSDSLNECIRIAIFKDTLPVVYRIEVKKDLCTVTKKIGTNGHNFHDIDKGYSEELLGTNQDKISRIQDLLGKLINHTNHYYQETFHGKKILIEMKFQNNYEFIITDELILSQLNQTRIFKRVLKLIDDSKTTYKTRQPQLGAVGLER